jgi:hypothetical protein
MPTFILGAGFNADAAGEAGPLFADSLYGEHYAINCGYPMVGDTLRLCFGLETTPDGKSIEDLFADAQEHRDPDPIQKLAQRLRYADYRIAQELASGKRANCYLEFFTRFMGCNFLTFNYDSLPETFLFHLGCWYPHDGYGIRVLAPLGPNTEESIQGRSGALVLHLHGSLSIRTDEYEMRRESADAMGMLTKRDTPQYKFEPSSIGQNFPAFESCAGSDDVEDRVIAPIPNKARAMKGPFIRDTYTKAVAVVRESDIVVAIGYRFNAHDRGSYQKLLDALRLSKGRRLLVVSPDADTVVKAIRPGFPDLLIEPLKATFKQWVAASFPGLDQRAIQQR